MVQPLGKLVPQKVKHGLTVRLIHLTPSIIPKINENMSTLKTYIQLFLAALFMIAKKWEQPKCPSRDEWINNNVVYPYNGVIFSYKREWSVMYCNMDELSKHFTKYKKPVKKWPHIV